MDTIFATATPPMKSGVAIIRVSGPGAFKCINTLVGKENITPRMASLCKLTNPQTSDLIDEAIILPFVSPNSFTGEDIIEFHTHGSRAVIAEILEVLSQIEGFRLAEPGEFSRRAFDNGKMDLTQAEGLADLIDAQTQIQARQAIRQKQGILKDLYDKWRKQLIGVLANVEAYIDFPDEEIPANIIGKIEQSIDQLKLSINKHLNDNNRGEKLRSGLHAVIAGPPNVGKSSLINCLARRDVAIVSDIAGTTRDVIEVHLDLKGYPVTLADTAGLRSKAESIEAEGIKRALIRIDDADIKIVMFDACGLPNIDKPTFDLIDEKTVIVINKIDLVKKLQIPKQLHKNDIVKLSINKQQGIDNLLNRIEKLASKHMQVSADPVITRQRHRNLLQETVLNLEKFNLNEELELNAEDLRQGAITLGRITGHIDVEEILDDIFSNFCIGK